MSIASIYSHNEEKWHTRTHLAGALFFSGAGGLLVFSTLLRDGMGLKAGSLFVYVGSLLILYFASALYHACPTSPWKNRLKLLDHLAIFFLICGSYTPFCLFLFPRSTGLTTLATVWSLALLGAVYEIYFLGKSKIISSLIYLGVSYPAVLMVKQIWHQASWPVFFALMGGGLAYILGIFFYIRKDMPYHHVIWHLFVLVGSLAHFVAITLLLL